MEIDTEDVNRNSDPDRDNLDSGDGDHRQAGGDQEFVAPKDGSWVPRDAANRMAEAAADRVRSEFSAEIGELKGQLKAMMEANSGRSNGSDRQFSRAELMSLVDNGQITQERADELLRVQEIRDIENRVRSNLETEFSTKERDRRVSLEIESYKNKVPGVSQHGTSERAAVTDEYAKLVRDYGYPDGPATELLALRSVFGPIDKVPKNGRFRQESSPEVGDGGGRDDRGDPPPTASPDGLPKGLTTEERAYYRDLISKGLMKPEDVAAEMKFANKAVRARRGAQV